LPAELRAQVIVAQGTIYHEIIQTAERLGADLIIMASHRPGLADYLLGPNAARVVRHFKGSVLVVRN
jgi:nucleotide-binding universal stress UspA family protein